MRERLTRRVICIDENPVVGEATNQETRRREAFGLPDAEPSCDHALALHGDVEHAHTCGRAHVSAAPSALLDGSARSNAGPRTSAPGLASSPLIAELCAQHRTAEVPCVETLADRFLKGVEDEYVPSARTMSIGERRAVQP